MLELIIFAPLIFGLLAYLLSSRPRMAEYLALLGSLLSLGFALLSVYSYIPFVTTVTDFYGLLHFDAMSAFFTLITALVSPLVFFYSIGYMRVEVAHKEVDERTLGKYYALLSLFLSAMFAATLASNFLVIWGAIEATTLASAFLISFYNTPESVEASWKFFVINSVGITVAFIGILLLGMGLSHGGVISLDLDSLISSATIVDPLILKVAIVFIFIGFGTKVGFVPLHAWLPDAHSQAPTPVSALLSGVLLNVALYAIIRTYQIVLPNSELASFVSSLFLFFGTLSLGFAAMRLYHQKNLKRLLAYSSIENMGVVALALGFGGSIGFFAAFFHLLSHSLAKPLAFLVGGIVTTAYHTKDIDKIKGAGDSIPLFGTLLMLVLLGVAGNIPFGTFFSEIALIAAGFSSGNYLLVLLVVVFIIAAFGSMLLKSLEMIIGPKVESAASFKPDLTMAMATVILMLLVLVAAFAPPAQLLSIIQLSIKALGGM
ncbi:hydrogenase 4 subunit F [Candidatus Micrarchaeota archaeon]|nr:hydrogenase 4 subunit F [Candidatus Micrarchaeota archaeon]